MGDTLQLETMVAVGMGRWDGNVKRKSIGTRFKYGQKMKLIYALQVCGLGARVYKGLIFGQLRICET
jgi:hypothetical protein